MSRKITGTSDNCRDSGECYSILDDSDDGCDFDRNLNRVAHTHEHDRDCHLYCKPQVTWVPPDNTR